MFKNKQDSYNNQLRYSECAFLILCVLYINNSLMFEELFSATIRGIMTLIAFGLAFVANVLSNSHRWTIAISNHVACFCIIAVACSAFSIMINGLNYEPDIYSLFLLILAMLISSAVSKETFYRAYVDVMTLIACCGVVCFLLYMFVPSLFVTFPTYYWHDGIKIKNCYLCVIPVSMQHYRNFGIFREPGMFSVFLVFALLIEMFFNKPNIKKVMVLFVALLTTLSTNGYICAIILLVAFMTTRRIKDNPYLKKNRRKIILALMVLVVCGVSFLSVNSQARVFSLGKLSEISVGDSVNSTTTGSGYERYRSIVYAIEAYLSDPFFGIGYAGWSEKFSGTIATATPINWFGLRGVIYGVMMNWFYFKNGFGIDKQVGGVITKVLLCVVLLCNIISQNMSSDIIMYLLILYQCNGSSRTNSEEEQEYIRETDQA